MATTKLSYEALVNHLNALVRMGDTNDRRNLVDALLPLIATGVAAEVQEAE